MNSTHHGLPSYYFGKLPISAEFIRRTVGAPEIGHLDAWFERGMHLGSRKGIQPWKRRFDQVGSKQFLYSSQGTSALLGGVCRFSRDRAGRRYPFLLGTRADSSAVSGGVASLPLDLAQFMKEAEGIVDSGHESHDLKSFRATLGDLRWQRDDQLAESRLNEELRRRSVWDLWRSTLDDGGGLRVAMLLSSFDAALQNTALRGVVIRVPCSGAAWEIGFWIALVKSWSPKAQCPTLSVWGDSERGGTGILSLVIGELGPELFEPVFWPTQKCSVAFDVASKWHWSRRDLDLARRKYRTLAEHCGSVDEFLLAAGDGSSRVRRRRP